MMGKRLLALLAAAGVFGLSPVYAFEDADAMSSEIKPYAETIAAVEDDTLDPAHIVASDDVGVEVASNDDSNGQSADANL